MRSLITRLLSALCAVLIAIAMFSHVAGVPAPVHTMRLANGHAVPVNEAFINIVVQIGIMIVSALLSYALAPKPKPPKPASITDFDIPTAEEGREIPVVFGTVWITGPNVLWYGDLRSEPIKKKGGKK